MPLLLLEDLFDLNIVAAVKGEPVFRKALMVHIAHDNIQIGVLCVVQIIDGSALQQVKILPEFRNHAGLYIDDLCIAEPLPQQCGERLGGLARFYQLPVDKALLFIIGKRGLPCQSAVFFFCHQAGFFQLLPEAAHCSSDILRQGIAVALSSVQFGLDQYQVICDAVVLYITLRIDMIQIIGAVRQALQIDRLTRIGASPQLQVIEE